MMTLQGKAWRFGDSVTTDHIAPGRYFHLRSNLPELARHALEDLRSDFASEVKKGDFIVTGKNFGLGSSREHAPTILKLAGVSAILAQSFARIFFRNAVNIGLPVVIMDTTFINEQDELEVSLEKGLVKNITNDRVAQFNPLSPELLRILQDGGLIEHVKKNGRIVV